MRYLKLILATWRLTALFYQERGPYAVFQIIRGKVSPTTIPETEIAKAFDCFWCLSLYMAVIVLILDKLCPMAVDILALSAGGIAVDRWSNS